ncbi:rifin [Plasmodium reichenowi]|uniref:Rifin n=1 Tax=Plasmodium reichenowi TaxID=5854 RepID=A0A060RM33_PLARE|nr:rifin [Plasmodium reichenowi]
MKLKYSKILLFFILLNILVTLYHENTHKKPSITARHTRRYTSRVLSEKDIKSSNYDKDAGMKSVMQQFVDRTSQRFEEYKERLKDKRQKRKEERDKNIQQIIEKDKMDKSLAEKVEKGCLKCGCALGGGVLPVWGLVCGVGYAVWSQHATKLAIQKGIAEGLKVGLEKVTEIVTNSLDWNHGTTMPAIDGAKLIARGNFSDGVSLYDIFKCISNNVDVLGEAHENGIFATTIKTLAQQTPDKFNSGNQTAVKAVANAFEDAKAAEFAAKTDLLSNTIIASAVTIIIIVLIMVIIYLVLRYRRKKKMKKKAQYTKLLNQ